MEINKHVPTSDEGASSEWSECYMLFYIRISKSGPEAQLLLTYFLFKIITNDSATIS